MAVLVDTDLLIGMERGAAGGRLDAISGEEDRAISVITVSELLHGVLRATGAIRTRRRAFVEHLLSGLEAVPITDSVARVHAEVWSDLAGSEQRIGSHDLWIAATAIAHGFALATGNVREFERIPGLALAG